MVIIVSGLPRSGTSMMMQCLAAGGLPVLVDKDNPSTETNPGGAFAYALTRNINPANNGWLRDAQGKAVKITAGFLQNIPRDAEYKVLFMERDIQEVAISHGKMADALGYHRFGEKPADAERVMTGLADGSKRWLSEQENIDTLLVDYNKLMTNPGAACQEIVDFLGVPLDINKMSAVPNMKYYRVRV